MRQQIGAENIDDSQNQQHSGVQTLIVPERGANRRLDNYLFRILKGVPKSHVYRIVRDGQVRVNGSRVGPDLKLAVGDRVRLPPIRLVKGRSPQLSETLLSLKIPVLYEDSDLLILDKPSGIAVHGGSGLRGGVIEILRHTRTESDFLELAHRLDKDTSGCLILAKTPASLRYMHTLFRENARHRRIQKIYHALVTGDWSGGTRRIDLGLSKRRPAGSLRRSIVSKSGENALSYFKPVERFGDYTLMEIKLGTGRMHQIRAHAAAVGHAVVGDKMYGHQGSRKEVKRLGIRRQLLHASRLVFPHPENSRRLVVRAPYPEDLSRVLSLVERG